MKSILWIVGTSTTLVLVVFVVGAAICNEHVVGYDGFVPVRRLETKDSLNRRTSRLAIDSAHETSWRGERKSTEYWEVIFPNAEDMRGIWIDTGNQFRTRMFRVEWLSVILGAAGPRSSTEPMRVHNSTIFGGWLVYDFDPCPITKIRLQYAGPEDYTNPSWTLRDVRFRSPGFLHWDKESYFKALHQLPVPAGVALLWWLLLAVLARRKPIQ